MELIRESELRLLLLEGKIEEFNSRVAEEPADLANTDLRAVDLQGANLLHANLRGAYLRNADLRAVDLFHADLEGASIHHARIAGTRFPPNLRAEEIRLSVDLGTRLRIARGSGPSS
ncbi:MAG: pentapeptide repeat-containing protein [Myxococcota bacterium]